MMKNGCLFQKVILIGSGRIVGEVLLEIASRREGFGFELECVEHEQTGVSRMETICAQEKLPFRRIPDKKELGAYFRGQREQTLIVSCGNNYIFPADIIAMSNMQIINFHNALLPKFPGRNATSWAILAGAKESGATWHIVTPSVDGGDRLWQGKCAITEDMKAYELSRDIMAAALVGFREIFDRVLTGDIVPSPQSGEEGTRMHYSWEIPGDGKFALTDAPSDIYRLLRAADYGKNGILPAMQTVLPDGTQVEVVSYRRKKRGEETSEQEKHLHEKVKEGAAPVWVEEDDRLIWFFLDEGNLLKIKYKEIKR